MSHGKSIQSVMGWILVGWLSAGCGVSKAFTATSSPTQINPITVTASVPAPETAAAADVR
jgi:hypothetical protein